MAFEKVVLTLLDGTAKHERGVAAPVNQYAGKCVGFWVSWRVRGRERRRAYAVYALLRRVSASKGDYDSRR